MRHPAILVAFGAATAALLGACSGSDASKGSTAGASQVGASGVICKPATPDSGIHLRIAPPGQRVDLATPAFSNPTNVVNPLFPIRGLSQAILVGAVDSEPLRIETTLMPRTLRIDMGDHVVETLASQFVAYMGRRIHEYALDRYAQADDGSVWYLGEDVFDYEDGAVADSEGTWLACRDGPAAMIMAAQPRVGDVWRTENVFGVVFEEISVKAVGRTEEGPRGPVAGVIAVQELHMDGELEDKLFAPGYGEFRSGAFPNLEATALAVPTNSLPGPTPAELHTLLAGAHSVFDAAQARDWVGASRTVSAMNGAWGRYRAGGVPRLLKPLMAAALNDVTRAVARRAPAKSRQAALDVRRNGLDLLLQYRSRIPVDFARLDLWGRQLVIDAEARDAAGISSDVEILKWILDRLAHAGDSRDEEDVNRAGQHLGAIRAAADRADMAAVLEGARHLQEGLRARINEEDGRAGLR